MISTYPAFLTIHHFLTGMYELPNTCFTDTLYYWWMKVSHNLEDVE